MDWSVVWENLPDFLEGLWVTIQLTAISVSLGLCLALPVAFARVNRLLKPLAYAFIFFFRGTPLLVQFFLVYYGAGQFRPELDSVGLWRGMFREAWFCGLFTLTLNTAAYTAEIIRGAIMAVPRGEIEAGRACGMSGALLYRRIILPKAARLALPAYGNEVIFLMQATSLASLITIMDLTGVARKLVAKSFAVYEVYLFTGLIYLLLTYSIIFVLRRIEKRLNAHLPAQPGQGNIRG
jgi:octopine/nopaline transport system permease protein/arginine/ornithine transport system permease protein